MNPDNLQVPDWVNWLAQDADGVVWGYEVEPLQHHQGWYENEVGRSINLGKQNCIKNWKDTLYKIKL